MIREKREKRKGMKQNKKTFLVAKVLLWEHELRVQRVLSSPYQICLVVVVLYNIHELEKKGTHIKSLSLNTTFRGYVQKLNRGKIGLLWIHTYLWVSL
jgi:hypothetical protein